MNIWLINHHANPPHEPGDARHYSHARELIRRGHQVRIVACNFDHLKRNYLPMTEGKTWEHQVFGGVPFTWITAHPYQTNFEVARIRNMIEFAHRAWKADWAAELPAPDLILGSSPDPFAALAAERLAARYRVPFVLEIRDLWPYVFTEVGSYSKYHPFVQLVDKVMRHLYSRAARIVMFSGNSAELLIRSGAAPEKIIWISHGVDLAMNPELGPPPDDGQFTVTYLGAHNQWNSLDAVLDAAKLLQNAGVRDVLFRFVGDGVSKPGLVERARAEGIHNVRFDDPVPKTQVPQIKQNSDAFIINNRKDAVSKGWMSFNKLYDYLAAGRPVVFGSCSGNDPVREAGAGISVNADDPAALAGAVEFLAGQSPEQLLEYGARGRKFIEQNYSIPVLVDRFEAMACEITGLPAGMVHSVCV
jgi:glycosyltransferase involved in cell wall biosynthesis